MDDLAQQTMFSFIPINTYTTYCYAQLTSIVNMTSSVQNGLTQTCYSASAPPITTPLTVTSSNVDMEVHNCSSLPTTLAGLAVSCVLLCYVTSLSLGHVYYFLPFISDISSFPPESCLYSLIMNPAAVIMTICLWIRNEQVAKHVTSGYYPIRSVLLVANRLNRWFMLSALFGYGVLINFQEVNAIMLHFLGTVVLFYSLGLYMVMDVFISYNTTLSTGRVAQFKLGLTIVHLSLAFTCGYTIVLLYFWFTGDKLTDFPHITPEDDGYIFHTITAIVQWLMILNFAAYLIIVSRDFEGISIKLPQVCSVTTAGQTQCKEGESDAKESDSD